MSETIILIQIFLLCPSSVWLMIALAWALNGGLKRAQCANCGKWFNLCEFNYFGIHGYRWHLKCKCGQLIIYG